MKMLKITTRKNVKSKKKNTYISYKCSLNNDSRKEAVPIVPGVFYFPIPGYFHRYQRTESSLAFNTKKNIN